LLLDDAIRSILREEVRAAVREELSALVPELRASPAAPDDFLSVREAARMAGVCPATVRTWLRSGRLTRYGSARLPRVRRADLLRFLSMPEGTSQDRSIHEQADSILSRQGSTSPVRRTG